MAKTGWSGRFADPIALPDGRILRTLREAADHVQRLPEADQALPHWQAAIEHLIYAAERKPAWMLLAWMAMKRAIAHGAPPRARTGRTKPAKAYSIIPATPKDGRS